MNIRPSILWFSVAVLVIVALIVWQTRKSNKLAMGSMAPAPVEIVPATQLATNAPVQSKIPTPATNAQPMDAAPVPQKSQADITRERFATENDVPIVFYGKLEDQFNNPVVGAEIIGNTMINNGVTNGHGRFSAMSDANGFFQIDAGRGADLGIIPKKEGYALATTRTSFKYSRMFNPNYFVPDLNNPVVIKMWKLHGAEPLVHFQIESFIAYNGTPTVFDLGVGKRVDSGGDIVITVESPPNPHAGQTYDWKANIKTQDGGLILSKDDYDQMFLAPDSGYDTELGFNYTKDTNPWSTGINNVYYFTSRRGRIYGRLVIQLSTDVVKNGGVAVTLGGYLNPAGSRNLEIDQSMVTEAHP